MTEHNRNHNHKRPRSITLWRVAMSVVVCLVAGWVGAGVGDAGGQMTPAAMLESGAYFPDETGNTWRYRGRMTTGSVERIADIDFVNVSTVTGREQRDGVMTTVFHDTNPGDQGPTDSYYAHDAAGIRYYGSSPGTMLERQLIPYQIARFPLEPGTFQQLRRRTLNLGMDLDRDNQPETVDVRSTVTVHGRESVTVPAGTYADAVRMEARMTLLVHLSRDGTRVHGTDTMTIWLAQGVGLVRYTERQVMPSPKAGRDRVIDITEELEEARLQGGTVHHGRRSGAAGL